MARREHMCSNREGGGVGDGNSMHIFRTNIKNQTIISRIWKITPQRIIPNHSIACKNAHFT